MSPLKPSSPTQRAIPSVDRVVRELDVKDLPRQVVVCVVRRELAKLRATGGDVSSPMDAVQLALNALRLCRIQPVINATGILIHTNLGRSPMGEQVVTALTTAASNYTNLEYDVEAGERSHRGRYVEHSLAVLCGADSATVVNNCAAALVLVLRHFAASPPRNQVIISRGELVQIGGGFRIPEILEASGAALCEVGTTNKTTADDYRRAVGPQTALILKVHHSNFFMGGFVESPTTAQIAMIAREAGVPFLEDLGSGATFDTTTLGPEREPTPAQVLEAGADLVCFSGDKLLGGPQSGIIAGRSAAVLALKSDPFFRALRCDKLILAALEKTVDLLLSDQTQAIPVRAMMQIELQALQKRAEVIVASLLDLPVNARVGTGQAYVGGGTLPQTKLPSVTVDLQSGTSVQALSRVLRLGQPPVVGYIQQEKLKLDLRTVFPCQDEMLMAAVRRAVTST